MDEPAGFQTAKINRTQRNNDQGGGAPRNQGAQPDPWVAPAGATSSSGWGNAPEAIDPPF
ncbi:hypothetical protein GCM10009784_15190 [Arthrobacter parietis]|jgi:hypothetical protein|uniref:Single-stranded DNA-binding protein n=2 Tax=Arthrobacter TaxID=1663 RepID=A0ABT6CWV5_9MICC|nr:hypothetical protein [Arthrobacter vasquezii]MDF9278569.1 hypothetical protein [Arthrobacter vasquezii]